jgi:hypothetical protein
MRPVLLLTAVCALAHAEDAQEIVRRAVALDEEYESLVRQYTFIQRSEQRRLDARGNIKDRDVKTWDVTLLEGSPYRRLIARDDRPLSAKEEEKEQQKLQKSIEERSRETDARRARRLAEWEKELRKERELFQEIPKAFDFRVIGEETIDGREVWVIEGEPKTGYKPKSREASVFPKIRGKLWITKGDYRFVKGDIETLDTISFGWFLARLAKGGHVVVEQTLVNNEVWLPKRVTASGSAKLALVKTIRAGIDVTYRDYRKFQAESRITAVEEKRESGSSQ